MENEGVEALGPASVAAVTTGVRSYWRSSSWSTVVVLTSLAAGFALALRLFPEVLLYDDLLTGLRALMERPLVDIARLNLCDIACFLWLVYLRQDTLGSEQG
jgi:hypothetical protein